MTLTWPVVFAVLLGAVLHAGWNTLVKSSGDKEVDTALVHFLGAVVALPLLLLAGLPPFVAWPFIVGSLLIHIAYYVTLAGAYKHGELGMTYPIMRGSAPLLVALGSSLVLGESLAPMAWVGVIAVTFGVALVGLAHPGEALHHRRGHFFQCDLAVGDPEESDGRLTGAVARPFRAPGEGEGRGHLVPGQRLLDDLAAAWK